MIETDVKNLVVIFVKDCNLGENSERDVPYLLIRKTMQGNEEETIEFPIGTIKIYYKNKNIAYLTRLSDSFFKKFTIDFAELEDLDGIYSFLKARKIKYRKL